MRKLLMILLVGIFCLSLASAYDSRVDNNKYYIQPTKTVQIKDWSIFGDDTVLIEAQLKTEQIVWVKIGSEVKVAEFSTKSLSADYDTWDKVITGMKFYDKNKGMKEITRAYTLKSFDGKEWKAIDMKGKIDKETIVGIFTKVESRDNIEWIMELGGFKVNEWATFVAIPYTEIKAEVDFGNQANPTNSLAEGVQTKWNITDVPAGAIITNASVCYYVRDGRAGIGNGISVHYVANQTWLSPSGSPISAAELNAMPLGVDSNETMLDIVWATWGCFNATTQLQEAIDNGDTYFTLRLWNTQFPMTTIASTQSNDVLFFGDMPNNHWLSFEGLSNAGETGKYANLDVRYNMPSNPGPKISTSLLKPNDGSNLTYSGINFNMSATPTNGNITNITLYIWNNKDSVVYTETQTFNSPTQVNMSVVKTLTNGYYNWSAYAFATNRSESNFSFAPANFTLFVNKPAPNITILYPVMYNNYSSNVSDLKFLVKGSNIDSCKYSTDNGITNVSTSCSLNVTGLTSHEGWNNWSVWANDSTGNVNNTFVEFFKDTQAPTVYPVYPSADYYPDLQGINLTINYSIVDPSIDSCWYKLDYNSTIVPLASCSNSSFTIYPTTNFGQHNLTIYANDTYGNTGNATSQFVLNKVNYKSSALETTSQKFNLTLYNISTTPLTSYLVYNSVPYSSTITDLGNNVYLLANEITVSSTNSQAQFYFNWTNGNPKQSPTFNQSIDLMRFQICNSAFDVTAINFSVYEATNPYPAVNAKFYSNWQYWVGDGSQKKNYSFENISESESVFTFCIYPNDGTFHVDADIQYSATGYSQNNHYFRDATLTKDTTQQKLYLLNSSSATLTELRVINYLQEGLSDRLIYIQYYDVGTGTYTQVGMAKTNYKGSDLAYLNWYDTFYRFVVIYNGTVEYSVEPYKLSSTPQTFKVSSTSTFSQDKFEDVEYSLYFNNVTNNFVLTFVDTSGLITSGCMKVIKTSEDEPLYDQCLDATSGSLSFNIGDNQTGTYIANFYAKGSFFNFKTLTIYLKDLGSIYEAIPKADSSFMSLLIVGTFGMIGLFFGPGGMVLMTIAGMFVSMALGMYSKALIAGTILLACVGGYFAFKSRT